MHSVARGKAINRNLPIAYVERYFDELPGTAEVHSGWVLADVAEAFFPLSSLDETTVRRAHALLAREDLDSSLRRRVVDTTDELEHRLAVVRAFREA